MTFSFPWVLLLLPAALLLLRRQPFRAVTVSSLAGWQNAEQPRRVRWLILLRILRTLACALLIIAMAGPRMERAISEKTHQGIAIEMLVDISSSMDRNITGKSGEKTTRMEAAKKTVGQFIANRPDDLIGLITFARYADTLSPLTFGHSALIQLTGDIKIQDRPNEDGTAYGDALSLACAHLDRMNDWSKENEDSATQVQSKTVILLTDGENNCGLHLPQEAAALAAQWNIRLYTIALGDAAEKPDELTDGEQLLQTISDATGGAFWKIYDLESLSDAYETIDRLEKSEIKNTTALRKEYRGMFLFFSTPALLLLITAQLLSATLLRITEEVAA